MNFIPYGKQNIDQNDINEVINTLKSDFLTTGPKIKGFEIKRLIYFIFLAISISGSSFMMITFLSGNIV